MHQMRLPGLVYDALPDGWGLFLMDRLFRSIGRDPAIVSPLDRLSFIGDRALGALSFVPADDQALQAQTVELRTLARQAKVVITGNDREALRNLALIGGSPHGARPKVLVNYDPFSGKLSTESSNPGQAWLMKFQAQSEHKEVCAIEFLYSNLAKSCGLDMPDTRYFDLDSRLACFGIRRFDIEDGMRVPMHTLAGTLHADFRLPSSVDYTTFLRMTRLLTHDEREVQKAFERAVFNVVFNNRDDHCKNFSFRLGRDRHWRLAPAYDLTYSEGPAGEHQMDVCGEAKAPSRVNLLRLAKEAGVDDRRAPESIDRMVSIASKFSSFATDSPIRARTIKALLQTVNRNIGFLRKPRCWTHC